MLKSYRWAAAAAVLALALTGCNDKGSSAGGNGGGGGGGGGGGSKNNPNPTPPAALAKITVSPVNGAKNVNPDSLITVSSDGTLSAVTVKNGDGKTVKGALAADKHSWTSAEELGYSKAYTVTSKAVNADGKATSSVAKFSTVVPDNFTMPYINTTGGVTLNNGGTYGVGTVIAVHFDEPIPNKAAAEKSLEVKTNPTVTGSWYWMDEQNVHWRPQKYWATGTKVSVTAKVYGKNFGSGLYGQADAATSFTIGESHISVADDNTKQVKVYIAGKLVRTMPTSMGMGGEQVIKGRYIHFWTQRGIYTVLDQGNPVIMDSETYGLPKSAGGYKEPVYWSTRISTDGIYLHSAPWSVWAQGNTDTSHGCLNLSPENAEWFYGMARPGDVVEVRNTGGPALEVWQNGDWSVSWKDWVAGSAL